MRTPVEQVFGWLDERAKNLEGVDYLEQFIQSLQEIEESDIGPVFQDLSKEQLRKVYQFILIKGLKGSTQPNHQLTPDAIGLLMSYLVEKYTKKQQEVVIADLANGTGNLLFTVMNHLDSKITKAYAVEIDELLVRLSTQMNHFLQLPIDTFIQDSLKPLFIEPVDVMIGDLPVGYYPDDENGLNFHLMPKEGHAFAHHLFIEQSVNYLKEDGLGIFIVPNHLFSSAQSASLHPYFKKEASILALFQLPTNLFKSEQHAKSVLVVKKGKNNGEVLLAAVPDMSNEQAMAEFFAKVNASL